MQTMRVMNMQWTQVSAEGQPEKKMPGFLKPKNFGLGEETNNKKEQNKINPDQNLELTNS